MMPKICSTCVRMIFFCWELHTTQEVKYSTNMKLLRKNIARFHKTLIKSKGVDRLYTKTKNYSRGVVTLCE